MIMKLISILALLAVVSCASKMALKTKEADLKGAAKFTFDFVKDKKKKYDISIIANGYKEENVAINRNDIGCGKGDQPGAIDRLIGIGNEPYITLSSLYIKKFIVVCANDTFKETKGNPYILIKNVYSTKDGKPNSVLASDIKIEIQ